MKAINLLSLQQDVNHIKVLSFLSFSYLMISSYIYVNLKWWLLNIEGAVFLSRKKKDNDYNFGEPKGHFSEHVESDRVPQFCILWVFF